MRVIALLIVVALAAPPGAVAQPAGRAGAATRSDRAGEAAWPDQSAGPTEPLDVPYVPQTGALCGGAAAAMVLRYWGARGVYAEDFASFIDATEQGIRTGTLVEAVNRRGWRAFPFRGSAEAAREHLAYQRPLVALVQERPGRYHFLVLVGWTGDRVIVHDPARGPFRTTGSRAFETAWAAAGYWTLLVLPPESRDHRAASREATLRAPPEDGAGKLDPIRVASPRTIAGDDCGPLVRRGVRLARAGDPASAEAALGEAARTCPGSAAAFREMAGLRFLQSRWTEAARLGEQAAALDPADAHAWRLVGASRFLQDDSSGALRAWNHAGEPRVDLTRIEGLARTRYSIVADLVPSASGFARGVLTVLTEDQLRRARRRLADLPAVSGSRVGYRPLPNGLAEVEVAIDERPLWPVGRSAVAALSALFSGAVRALTDREAVLRLASPTGGGELWSATWRWWDERPRIALSLAAPRLAGLPGVWRVDGSWEQQAYLVDWAGAGGAPRAIRRERREHAGLTVADWGHADLKWELSAGLDRWLDRGSHVALGGALERRSRDDLLALRVEAARWAGFGRGGSFASGRLLATWRSSAAGPAQKPIWLLRASAQAVGAGAPLDLWPGAGVGHVRGPLLRAHPLLDEGVIRTDRLGRALLSATVEHQRPLPGVLAGRVGLAMFADAARAWQPPNGATTWPMQIDVGAGLRLMTPGREGIVRVDLARGLRDGGAVLSAGWQLSWPAF